MRAARPRQALGCSYRKTQKCITALFVTDSADKPLLCDGHESFYHQGLCLYNKALLVDHRNMLPYNTLRHCSVAETVT